MAQLTYGDLLSYLGLSNWQFMVLTFIALFLWVTVSALWKIGAIDKVKVVKKVMPQFQAIYISYEGSYDSIGVIYSQSVEDFQMVFKFSNYFVIYYPNSPKTIQRAIIGVAINKIQRGKIPLFLSKFPLYKTCKFSQNLCLSTSYPLISSASYLMVIKHVYPVIEQKLKQLKIPNEQKPIMEIYHLETTNSYIDVICPIENVQRFQLWYQPTDYSRVFSKKAQ